MKSIISINKKFMGVLPKDLVNMILASKYTKGFEVYIEYEDIIQRKYLDDLVYEIKKNNLILQIHGEVNLDFDTQLEYMKRLESYSDLLGYPIIVTLHSLYDPDKDVSVKKSIEYLGDLVNNIDNEKIIISLENLNDSSGRDKLEKEYITNMILNDENIYFTYDIGHELADYGNVTNMNRYLVDVIRNIHFHTHDEVGNDHQPIYPKDKYWNDLMKSLIYLINNHYEGNIVYEYDLYACRGETIEEKIQDYLDSIDLVSEKYN